jgi:hypothetical protein
MRSVTDHEGQHTGINFDRQSARKLPARMVGRRRAHLRDLACTSIVYSVACMEILSYHSTF